MLALLVVVSYMLVLVAVGLLKSRHVHDQAGFALAGRRLGPWMLVGTLLATWTGTGSIFGNAEQAYQVGLVSAKLLLVSRDWPPPRPTRVRPSSPTRSAQRPGECWVTPTCSPPSASCRPS